MRCTAYCAAESFNTPPLFLAKKAVMSTRLFRDVIYFAIDEGHAFCFPFGCIIFWGLSEEREREFLNEVAPYTTKALRALISDSYTFSQEKNFSIEEDHITLHDEEIETKLAVSHALAQSINLGRFENSINETIDETKQFPEELAAKGKISLSQRSISRRMGKLFIELANVNLHSETLDVPEYFWDHTSHEQFYQFMVKYLDVKQRVDVLNMRLDVVRQLFDMLNSQLNHEHSARLEWIIIILILIEVFVILSKEIFHLF